MHKYFIKIFSALALIFLTVLVSPNAKAVATVTCTPAYGNINAYDCTDSQNLCQKIRIEYNLSRSTGTGGQPAISVRDVTYYMLVGDPNRTYHVNPNSNRYHDRSTYYHQFAPPHQLDPTSNKPILSDTVVGHYGSPLNYGQPFSLYVFLDSVAGWQDYCGPITFILKDYTPSGTPKPTTAPNYQCNVIITGRDSRGVDSLLLRPSDEIFYNGNITTNPGVILPFLGGVGSKVTILVRRLDGPFSPKNFPIDITRVSGSTTYMLGSIGFGYPLGHYVAQGFMNTIAQQYNFCPKDFWITPDGRQPTPTPTERPSCRVCTKATCFRSACYGCPACVSPTPPIPSLQALCDQIAKPDHPTFKLRCEECIRKGEIWSAFGCLPVEPSRLVSQYIFTYGIGIAGGIAFLYFIYGCFLILTSAGNAEQIEEAKQIIISALSGLLLIIFSIFFLRIIGVDILQLPGFS